jgi:hypothetical protein
LASASLRSRFAGRRTGSALVGEHGPDPGHDGEGGQEQTLEQDRVVDVGTGGGTGDRYAIAGSGEMVLAALLATVCGLGADQIAAALGPHRGAVEDEARLVARKARHGVPSRRNRRRAASTRTVVTGG